MRSNYLLCSAIFLTAMGSPTMATTVKYGLGNVSGNTWQYEFTIVNDTLTVPIDEFTVFFDRAFFGNITPGLQPSDWDPVAAQPDFSLPQDGFFDALATGNGVAVGASLSGFQVLVDYSGPLIPGRPSFSIVDPVSFSELDQGLAIPVHEPSKVALLAMALLAAGYCVRQKRGVPGNV